MAYLNKCLLIGNIGKEPEVRTSTNSKSVKFSLATSKRYRDAAGEQKEITTWHNIVIWGKTADTFIGLGLHKGTSLYIEGEITNRTYQDSTTGQNRYVTEINASTFQILTPRNGNQQGQQQTNYDYSQPYNQSQQAQQPAYPSDEDLDGLPF